MDKKRARDIILIALFAIGYIALMVIATYGFSSLAPPGGGVKTPNPFPYGFSPWG